MAVLILLSSCASTITITSIPSEAKLYLNGEYVGNTPYKHRDTKIVGSSNTVRIEKKGLKFIKQHFLKTKNLMLELLLEVYF